MQTRVVPSVLPPEGYVRLRQIIGGRRTVHETDEHGDTATVEVVDVGVFPMSKTSWLRGVAAGKYPRGIKHGAATLYPVEQIRELLDQLRSPTSSSAA
jgi:hypothetical protein